MYYDLFTTVTIPAQYRTYWRFFYIYTWYICIYIYHIYIYIYIYIYIIYIYISYIYHIYICIYIYYDTLTEKGRTFHVRVRPQTGTQGRCRDEVEAVLQEQEKLPGRQVVRGQVPRRVDRHAPVRCDTTSVIDKRNGFVWRGQATAY